MAFCTSCGAEMEAGATFCSKCGTKLVGETEKPDYFTKVKCEPPVKGATPQGAYEARDPYGGDVSSEAYLDGFSWAPGCGFYFWSRAMWGFWLATILLNILSYGISEEGELTAIDLILGAISFFGLIVILIWAGRVGRRRRWEMLKFTSFDVFRKNENAWNIAGIIGWVIFVLSLVGAFFIGFFGEM